MSVQSQIIVAANQYGVDPNLALAVAQNESGFNQSAISSSGAIGVMQLMPSTAAWLGVDPYNVNQNIDGGVRYLSMMLDQFADPATAVAAYNMGPGAVESQPAWYPETQTYVARVMADYGQPWAYDTSTRPTFSTTIWGESPRSSQYAGITDIGGSGTLLLLLIVIGVVIASSRQ